MAVLRTNDPDEALGLIEQLEARGYEITEPRRGRGGVIATNRYRVTYRGNYITVCYYSPTCRRPIPQADPVSRKGSNQHVHPFKGRTCPCGEPSAARGLCIRCWARYCYWKDRRERLAQARPPADQREHHEPRQSGPTRLEPPRPVATQHEEFLLPVLQRVDERPAHSP